MEEHPKWCDEEGNDLREFYAMIEADDEPYGPDPSRFFVPDEEGGDPMTEDEMELIYCEIDREEAEAELEQWMREQCVIAILQALRPVVVFDFVVSGEGLKCKISRAVAA